MTHPYPLSPPHSEASTSSSDSVDLDDLFILISRFQDVTAFTKWIQSYRLDKVQQLLSEGEKCDPIDVMGAANFADDRIVAAFLDHGASPNARPSYASPADAGVEPGWANCDTPVWFEPSHASARDWYPLMAASYFDSPGGPASQANPVATMRLLLRHGADPYAEIRYPIMQPDWGPYPGQDFGAGGQFNSTAFPDQWGVRSVVHSLIEDGAAVLAFFDTTDFSLDLERRDAQGRTILQAICRCCSGPDTPVGATGFERDQYSLVTPEEKLSLFHTARLHGADMLAVDNNDKNILHHMLEAEACNSFQVVVMKDALTWTLAHHPQLLHKPDRYGNYPLHSSLQRLQYEAPVNRHSKQRDVESTIHQLLDAGADPLVRDARGNTALHYLAECGLIDPPNGEAARQLLRRFVNDGVDGRVRNGQGMTALRMFLKHASYSTYNLTPDQVDSVDREVLALFEQAGVDWMERDGRGQTLLHVARKSIEPERAAFRSKYLGSEGY